MAKATTQRPGAISDADGRSTRDHTAARLSRRRRPVALFFDRDRIVAAAMTVLLKRECLVRSVSAASQAVHEIATTPPDVAILRISENAIEAVWLAHLLRARLPQCRLVIVVDSPATERADVISSIGGDALLTGPLNIELLLAHAKAFLGERRSDVPSIRPTLHDHVGRAISYVVGHYQAPLPTHAVARAVGLSRSRLASLFQSDVGMTLKTFLVHFRLEVARRFLVETQDKLETIATAVGFCDGPHLCRSFRQYLGHPPSRYRPALISRLPTRPNRAGA